MTTRPNPTSLPVETLRAAASRVGAVFAARARDRGAPFSANTLSDALRCRDAAPPPPARPQREPR